MTKDLTLLVKGDLLINSDQPEKEVLELLLRFTTITAWKLFEGDAQSQLYLIQYVANRLKTEYRNVTIQMFEAAIIEKHREAYERSAAALFDLLDYWLVDNSKKLADARDIVKIEAAPQLPARTVSQMKADRLDLMRTVYNSVKAKETVFAPWSKVLEWLTELGIHEPDSEISLKTLDISEQAVTNKLKEQGQTGTFTERSEIKYLLMHKQNRKSDFQSLVESEYCERICRYYFAQPEHIEAIERAVLVSEVAGEAK